MRVIFQYYHCLSLAFFCLNVFTYSKALKTSGQPKEIKVAQINIFGNYLIDQSKIRSVMSSQVGQVYQEKLLTEDMNQILQIYQKKGYGWTSLKVNKKEVNANRLGSQIVLDLHFDEIKSVSVGRIKIIGNQLFNEVDLQSVLALSGNLTRKHLQEGIERLLEFYSEHGYPKTKIRLQSFQISKIERKPKRHQLDFQLVIEEGEKQYFGEVKVRGLQKTKFALLEKELLIKSGQLFDQRKIDQSIHRLRNLGYFYQVKYQLIGSPNTNNIDFVADVIEARTGRLSGVIGLKPKSESETDQTLTSTQLVGMLEAMDNNLFGSGRKIELQWKSTLPSHFEIVYEEPWLLNRPISLGLSYRKISRSSISKGDGTMPRSRQDSTQITQPNLTENSQYLISSSKGFSIIPSIDELMTSIYLKIRFFHQLESQFTLSYKRIFLPAQKNILTRSMNKKYAIRAGLMSDTRDFYLSPTTGHIMRISFESSKGDLNYYKGWVDLEKFFQLWAKQVFAVGSHIAIAWGDDLMRLYSIPTERFFLGGAKSLRGYEEDWFSGLRRFHSNFEYRYHIGYRSQLFVFLDCGTVARQNWQFDTIKIGYGPGLRLESQKGIVFTIDYGLEPNTTLTTGKLHLNLGATF